MTTSSEPDDLGGPGQLVGAQFGEAGLLLLGRQSVERLTGFAQRRVLQIAFLATGAAHENGVHALGLVHRHRRRALRRFVVGMGVHGEQTEPFVHERERYRPNPPRRLHRRASPRCHPDLARRARVAGIRLPSRRPAAATALPSQNGSVSTTCCPDGSRDRGRLLHTQAADAAAPGGPIEVSTTNTGVTIVSATCGAHRHGAVARRRPIDPRYTCKGANVAPALSWSPAPSGTQEIAVTMIDEDADFDHWTMAGIKPDVTSMAENTPPEGAVAALNGAGKAAYTGPCPPSGTHTYRITVYYLDPSTAVVVGWIDRRDAGRDRRRDDRHRRGHRNVQ
jgi:Raf kinase inhibitor-like YbhB/YbcL family protein